MKIENQFRQGDVMIERVDTLPVKPKRAKRVVLAHGVATGHSHEIADANVAGIIEVKEPWVLPGDLPDAGPMTRFALEVRKDTHVIHQEHNPPIPLPKGKYRVTRQREYTPAAPRNVMD